MRPIDSDALVKKITKMNFGDMSSDEIAMVFRIHDMIIDSPTIRKCGTKYKGEVHQDLGTVLYVERGNRRERLGYAESVEYVPGERGEATDILGAVYDTIAITPGVLTIRMMEEG